MNKNIRQDNIVGSRRFSNYFWGISLFIGGFSFLLAGLSSYLKVNLLPFTNTIELVFIPQGIVMTPWGPLEAPWTPLEPLGGYLGPTWDHVRAN